MQNHFVSHHPTINYYRRTLTLSDMAPKKETKKPLPVPSSSYTIPKKKADDKTKVVSGPSKPPAEVRREKRQLSGDTVEVNSPKRSKSFDPRGSAVALKPRRSTLFSSSSVSSAPRTDPYSSEDDNHPGEVTTSSVGDTIEGMSNLTTVAAEVCICSEGQTELLTAINIDFLAF